MSDTSSPVPEIPESGIARPLTPITPDTPDSPPSSPSVQAAPPAPYYRLSPHSLHRVRCACDKPKRDLADVNAYMNYMLDRLDKLWRRLMKSRMPEEVKLAFVRALSELRSRGYHLFHLVGHEGEEKVQGIKRRREISVVLLVPDQEAETAHRALAEVMVHINISNGPRQSVENVAVRFHDDWEDWTVVQPHEYVLDERKPGLGKQVIPGDGSFTGRMVLEMIWTDAMDMLGKGCRASKSDFTQRLSRVLQRLNGDGLVFCAYEVDNVYREAKSKTKAAPAMRISLWAKPIEWVDGDEQITEGIKQLKVSVRQDEGEKDAAEEEDHVAAVILFDISINGPTFKVKHIAVVYDGEWPIAHHYRKTIPPPSLPGLEALVKET